MDEAAVLRYITENCPGTNSIAAFGDTFFIYDPDRNLPANRQLPFATLVTGDRYDQVSRLDRDRVYRLNIGLTTATYRARFGSPPADPDYSVLDTLLPHPVYAGQHWVCVLAPTEATFHAVVRPLLEEAHRFAARKHSNQAARRDG